MLMQADQPAQAEEGAAKPPAAAAAAHDPIAGALQRFGLKHASRPVGVAKIDLASSFTDASSPAVALSSAASKPAAASKQWLIMHVYFALCCHGRVLKTVLPLFKTPVGSQQELSKGSVCR